jgi:hypothetical protein
MKLNQLSCSTSECHLRWLHPTAFLFSLLLGGALMAVGI